jgi:hypothetical protein
MGSINRRIKDLEALYGDGDILPVLLARAFARVGEKKMGYLFNALVVREVFAGEEVVNLADLPYEHLTPLEIEALERLREVLEEEIEAA